MNVAARAAYLKNLNNKLAAVHKAAGELTADYASVDVALADLAQLDQLEHEIRELRKLLASAITYR